MSRTSRRLSQRDQTGLAWLLRGAAGRGAHHVQPAIKNLIRVTVCRRHPVCGEPSRAVASMKS